MSRLVVCGIVFFGLVFWASSCEKDSGSNLEFVNLSTEDIDILFVSVTEGFQEILGVKDSVPDRLLVMGGFTGYGALDPTWGKNGRQYAFSNLEVRTTNGLPFHCDILVRNLDSAAKFLTLITYSRYTIDSLGIPHGTVNLRPDWSLTTNKIVFISKSDLDAAFNIFVSNVSDSLTGDSIPLRLTDSLGSDLIDMFCYPSFSPDGSKIVYTSKKSGNEEIWAMNADGSGKVQLTDLNASIAGRPRYSPSGDKIAFYSSSTASGGDSLQVYIMDPNGSNPQQITTSGNNIEPAWSPDGNHIIYSRRTPSNGRIYMIDRTGQNEHAFISDKKATYPIWRTDNP